MKTKTCTKIFHFSYGHYLPDHFGKCKNQHGHNAKVEVSFTGYLNEQGVVVDFYHIKELVIPLLELLDHKNLNEVKELESYMPPTAENISQFLVDRIISAVFSSGKGQLFHKVTSVEVKFWESESSSVTCSGGIW